MDGSLKPRISFVTSLPPFKGISAYSLPLLQALSARDDVEMEAISFKRLYPQRLYPGGSQIDSTTTRPVLNLPVKDSLDGLNPVSWVGSALSIRGDILHAQWWSQILAPAYMTLLATAKLRGRRTLLTVHNVTPHEPSPWKWAADRGVMSLIDHFIVHTPENARALAALAPHAVARTSVIAMGPEKSHVSTGIDRTAARSKLGIGRSDKVVLFFGNIRPYKRLDVMLNAFELVRHRLPDARLLVIGQPWSGSSEVERALNRAPSVAGVTLRTEYVPESEVEAYFIAADLVACPYSGFEAQSGAASMAVAYGKALLVSRTGGLTSFVKDEKAIVPPGDVLRLANAVEAILTDLKLRRKLEQDSKRVARESSWENVAAETASLYKRLMRADDEIAA